MVASARYSYRPRLDADGVEVPAPDVEHDAGQRPAGRSGDGRTRPQVAPSLMAGTVEAAFGWAGNHGTGQVRALLAERHELARGQPHQQARLLFVRVGEDERAANREIVDRRDPPHR